MPLERLHRDGLAGKNERRKHRVALVAAEAFAAIHQLLDAHFDRFCHGMSGEIKKTKPRQVKLLEKALLDVLAFELAQLSRRHPPAVRRQLPVEFAADGQQ